MGTTHYTLIITSDGRLSVTIGEDVEKEVLPNGDWWVTGKESGCHGTGKTMHEALTNLISKRLSVPAETKGKG